MEISQYTRRTALRAKAMWALPPSQERYVTGFPLSLGNVHVVDWPSIVTCSIGSRACALDTVPVRFWQLVVLHRESGLGRVLRMSR